MNITIGKVIGAFGIFVLAVIAYRLVMPLTYMPTAHLEAGASPISVWRLL